MEEIDYSDLLKNRIEQEVLNGYKAKPEFEQDCANLMTALGLTYEKFNKFLNDAANIEGVSPETALHIYVLTLQLK